MTHKDVGVSSVDEFAVSSAGIVILFRLFVRINSVLFVQVEREELDQEHEHFDDGQQRCPHPQTRLATHVAQHARQLIKTNDN